MLQDEVWRLEKIGKDGAFHKKLSKEGIKTVQDFLKLSVVDPRRLRQVYIYTLNFLTLFCNRYNEILIFPVCFQILGIGMSEKMWEVTIKHAKTCDMGSKLYIYRGPHFAVLLSPICQLIKAEINGQIFPGRELNNINRVHEISSNYDQTQLINPNYYYWFCQHTNSWFYSTNQY